MKTDSGLCVFCKGTKGLCGVSPCPKLSKLRLEQQGSQKLTQNIFGPSPPNLFVGSYGYPEVNWGPMVGLENVSDSPAEWYGLPYEKIIGQLSSLVRGKKQASVFTRDDRMLEKAQEAAMSTCSVDMEVNFTKKPRFAMQFSSVLQPMGAAAPLKNMKVVGNPKIPRKVDQVVSENLRATDAIAELSQHRFDTYYLTRLFSAGLLGQEEKKKLVPLRWSITALDDIMAKQFMEKIRQAKPVSDFLVYSNEYLYNHFEILLMPGAWEFENFESWAPNTIWSMGAPQFITSEEYEPFTGRTSYADKQVGGYYAARFGVCEALACRGKQARVVSFREIYEGYQVPIGSWEIKENVRHAFLNQPQRFSTLSEALGHLRTRLRVPLETYLKKSQILQQSRLTDF